MNRRFITWEILDKQEAKRPKGYRAEIEALILDRDERGFHLDTNDPRYGKLVLKYRNHPPASAPVTGGPAPCVHRGDFKRKVGCVDCSGKARIKSYACDVHGECTLAKKTAEVSAVCGGCKDYLDKLVAMPVPLYTDDGDAVNLNNHYRGRSCFLICGGPSFAGLDHEPLKRPGILTMGLNNSVRTFRPNLWTHVDGSDHFIRSIYLDPSITKFIAWPLRHQKVFDNNRWKWTDTTLSQVPNTFYYKRNACFIPGRFLHEDTICWGNSKENGGTRSVMLPAFRLLQTLGIKRIYLLGCDFSMDKDHTYHFDQDRANGSVSGNNATYRRLNDWFAQLRPRLEEAGITTFNCNSASRLEAFDHMAYSEAISNAMAEFDFIDVTTERTLGLYDRKKTP